MTTLVARQPLLPLSMSSAQRAPRRLSARLQEKDEARPAGNGIHGGQQGGHYTHSAIGTKRAGDVSLVDSKKRKIDYDEDDEGFQFSRVKQRRPPTSNARPPAAPALKEVGGSLVDGPGPMKSAPVEDSSEPGKKRRNKMSFSTPKTSEGKSVRRTKRLSNEHDDAGGSPKRRARRKQPEDATYHSLNAEQITGQIQQDKPPPAAPQPDVLGDDHSATRIALPFADTPVIRRNKAMREGKSGKGERRSSLGLRGRRASSLIESGNSNALPHAEVEVQDFYKHIECESLPEPKRMRQLLTWCATRALGEKPTGTDFEDVSVKQAARVIQEELLKELSNKSEMSDWFGRDDVKQPDVPLKERPHPKNVQNEQKIQELEQQIRRLRAERDSLESLLRRPAISPVLEPAMSARSFDTALLSESDLSLWNSLHTSNDTGRELSKRLNSITSALGPTVDAFADGIHMMDQYRAAADNVASRTLAICAEKLAERDRLGRKRALQNEESSSPKNDLGNVLRSLAQVDR